MLQVGFTRLAALNAAELNRNTAAALGLTIPLALQVAADRLIE
jgi:hypothetical protein